MIDDFGSRLDGLVDIAFDFYYRRMTVTANRLKTLPAKEPRRTSTLDPVIRILQLVTLSDGQLRIRPEIALRLHTRLSKVIAIL